MVIVAGLFQLVLLKTCWVGDTVPSVSSDDAKLIVTLLTGAVFKLIWKVAVEPSSFVVSPLTGKTFTPA